MAYFPKERACVDDGAILLLPHLKCRIFTSMQDAKYYLIREQLVPRWKLIHHRGTW